jgi:hypothetical protein
MNLKSKQALVAPLTLGTILAFGANLAWIFFCLIIYAVLKTGHVLPEDSFIDVPTRSVALLLLSPLMFGFFYLVIVPVAELAHTSYFSELHRIVPYAVPPLILLCVMAAVLTVIYYRRQRSYSERGAVAWSLFVFLLGAPGFIGYMLHRNWPAKEICAKCGAISPRDRDACLKCDTEFPLPALKGIEIFA